MHRIQLSILLAGLLWSYDQAQAAPPSTGLNAGLASALQPLVIDGALDEAGWRDAPDNTTFIEYEPHNGAPAADGLRTSVKLLIDADALVFGIRAWDSEPEKMRGALGRRDKVGQEQDFIGIWIDPIGRGQAAQFVRVGIAGVISDGLHFSASDESDLGPDFPVDAAVRRLADGYSMEVRWPLSSLRFPYQDGKDWRVMVERNVPHAGGTLLMNVPLKTGAISYIHAMEPMAGMGETVQAVRDRRFVEWRPELTMRRQEGGATATSLGLEINARPRADWVLNATLNPDFSQVEIDEPTAGASQIALSLPEKRGFFLESADVLGLPLAPFYSRTIADPRWGLRATWRNAQFDATAMSLRDRAGGIVLRGGVFDTASYVQTRESLANFVRARWHTDGALFGAFLSSRDYGSAGANTVLGVDGKVDIDGGENQAAWFIMHSRTTAAFADDSGPFAAPAKSGAYLRGKLRHSSASWSNELVVEAISHGFANDNGFAPQTGVIKSTLDINRRLGPRQFAFGPPLHEVEAHLGMLETRTLRDDGLGQPGNQIIARKLQPGFWMYAPGQTRLWSNLGFDQQRGHVAGKLHDTPAVHFGLESSPLPWLANVSAEVSLGRQLDVEADRVGRGGNVLLGMQLRYGLPFGWATELDHRVNRTWVNNAQGQAGFADTGWRWLGMLHFGPRDSLRLLAQNTAFERRFDASGLAPQHQREIHRSLLYRHLWRHGRSMSLAYAADKPPVTRVATLKFQWEI
jgi:hypothetical protein